MDVAAPDLFIGERVNFLRTDGDFCHQGQDTETAKKVNIVETYRYDHSLESP
jgi:hypothetical protein